MRRGDGIRDLDAPEVVHVVHLVWIIGTVDAAAKAVGVDHIRQIYPGCSLDYLRRWQATDEMPTCVACVAQTFKASWGA